MKKSLHQVIREEKLKAGHGSGEGSRGEDEDNEKMGWEKS